MVKKLSEAREPAPDRLGRRARWDLVAGLMMALLAATTFGQDAGSTEADKAVDELRGRAPVGEEDDRILDAWIQQELSRLDEDPTNAERANAFRTRFVAQITHSSNSPEFVARLADRVGLLFTPRLAECDKLAPPVARALAGVLRQFDRPGVMDALEAGLRCESRQDVRYLCAQGFVRLRDNIAVNPVLTERFLRILRTAGQAETSGMVTAQIYEALSFRSADRMPDAMAVMLDIWNARIEKRRAVPVCDGGELGLLNFVTANRPTSRPLLERLVPLLAVQLRLDVTRLEQERLDEYERMQLLASVDAGEALLTQLVSPSAAPNVRNALRKGDDVRMLEVQIELNKWIGTPNAPGVLNASPWNVPVGAP